MQASPAGLSSSSLCSTTYASDTFIAPRQSSSRCLGALTQVEGAPALSDSLPRAIEVGILTPWAFLFSQAHTRVPREVLIPSNQHTPRRLSSARTWLYAITWPRSIATRATLIGQWHSCAVCSHRIANTFALVALRNGTRRRLLFEALEDDP